MTIIKQNHLFQKNNNLNNVDEFASPAISLYFSEPAPTARPWSISFPIVQLPSMDKEAAMPMPQQAVVLYPGPRRRPRGPHGAARQGLP